jgi:hypothetical protein
MEVLMDVNDFVYVGSVWVDAGVVWVGDPCYSITGDSEYAPKTWSEFCDQAFDPAAKVAEGVCAPLKHGKDGNYEGGLGLEIRAGFGDGAYPVYVKYSDEGDWGMRVSAVVIDFLGQLGFSDND